MNIPARKLEELSMYESLYSQGHLFASTELREGFLKASEEYFRSLITKFSPKASVLEIGCGEGIHSILAAQSGAAKVLGIDISQAGIARADKKLESLGNAPNVTFKVMDVEALELSSSPFDLIIDHESFSSIDLNYAVPTLTRVLKTGGRIIAIECLSHNPIFQLNRVFNRLLGKRTSWATKNIFNKKHFKLFSESFEVEDIHFFHFITVFAFPFKKLPLGSSVVKIAEKIDQYLLTLPYIKFLAFKCVVTFKKIK